LLVYGQTNSDAGLVAAQTVSGAVVDREGKPIAGVRIDHAGKEFFTDAGGRFQLTTQSPAIVFRKVGYTSYFLRTLKAGELRIALEPADARAPQACSGRSRCESIEGWSAVFCFPAVQGVTVGQPGRDVDYGFRSYFIDRPEGALGIGHGSGPLWSFGLPMDRDVWQSIEYRETVSTDGSGLMVDARGRTAAGKLWRSLGRFGESASYYNLDSDSAKLLDRVLDGVCLRR
jgi:hypothetical protein